MNKAVVGRVFFLLCLSFPELISRSNIHTHIDLQKYIDDRYQYVCSILILYLN